MTKCYYCKKTGQTVAHVKECATGVKPMASLEEILGTDVNPDSKVELDKWQAAQQAEIKAYDAEISAPVVPAHKAAKLAMFGTTGKVAPAVTLEQADKIADAVNAGDATGGIDFKKLVEENKAAAAAKKTGQDLELGMYQVKDANGVVTIFKIKFNKAGTLKFAEKLVISQKAFYNEKTAGWDTKPSGKFWYAPGMMAKLTSDNKMTDADAKAFHDMTKAKYGVDYGFCCVCGKLLTVKKSIDAGIGPVCQSKF